MEEAEAASLEGRGVLPGAPKSTSDNVTLTLPNQDWIRVETKSRKRQRSPDLVAARSEPRGATESGGQDKRTGGDNSGGCAG